MVVEVNKGENKMTNRMQRIGSVLALSLASLALAGCSEKQAEQTPAPINEADPLVKQWREKGYIDVGEGVFVIPQTKGRNVMGDINFGKALKRWKEDHPQLEIVRTFEIDGDSSAGTNEVSLHNRDGLVLWTRDKETGK